MNNTESLTSFEEKLRGIRLIADELPIVVVIHRIHDFYPVYMNQPGLTGIGATLEDVQRLSNEEYHKKYFNSEDSDEYVPKLLNLIARNTDDQVSFFQQVRTIYGTDWTLYVSNSKVFYRNEAGEPTHMITTAGMLDPVHHITSKVNRLMDEINFLRNNTVLFAKLTRREKQVLKSIALGLNSGEIAANLFISSSTVDTHRRNIRNKLGLKNNYDAVKFAQAYNLV